MKKYLIHTILLIIMIICCGCRKQALPMPEYPLDENSVKTALTETDLSWKIKESEIWGEGRILYELTNEEEKGIAVISSVGEGNTRTLQLSFFSDTAIDASLPEKDWEKAICLATILYGGFADKGQVYEAFQETIDEASEMENVPGVTYGHQKRMRWEREVNGVECFIGFGQNGEDGDAVTELVSIVFHNKDSVKVE